MAIYDFKCTKCHITETLEMTMDEYSKNKNAIKCKCGEKMERIFTPIAATIYECGGFYDTTNRGISAR